MSKFRVIACLQIVHIRTKKIRPRGVGDNCAVRKSEEYIPLAHHACRSVVILYYLGKCLLSASQCQQPSSRLVNGDNDVLMGFQCGLDILGLVPGTGGEYQTVSPDRPGVLSIQRVVVKRIGNQVVDELPIFVHRRDFFTVFLANRVNADATGDVVSYYSGESAVDENRVAVQQYQIKIELPIDALL